MNVVLNDNEKIFIDNLICRYPCLISVREQIESAYLILRKCFEKKGKLLIAGNGGSASDAEHIAGELMKVFKNPRPITQNLSNKLSEVGGIDGEYLSNILEQGLAAIPLVSSNALFTAFINDADASGVFAQQLLGYAKENDVFLGISTSGNSKNVYYAVILAKALGLKVIALTGNNGGRLANVADIVINVPETDTYLVQELHLPIYHCLCLMLENYFFPNNFKTEI